MTAGTLELRTNLNQFAAASGAGRSRLVLVTLVFVLLHWHHPWLDCVACWHNHLPKIQPTVELIV
jgi:hypothetical protein